MVFVRHRHSSTNRGSCSACHFPCRSTRWSRAEAAPWRAPTSMPSASSRQKQSEQVRLGPRGVSSNFGRCRFTCPGRACVPLLHRRRKYRQTFTTLVRAPIVQTIRLPPHCCLKRCCIALCIEEAVHGQQYSSGQSDGRARKARRRLSTSFLSCVCESLLFNVHDAAADAFLF